MSKFSNFISLSLKTLSDIVNDTLKKKDKEDGRLRFSRTSFVMFSCHMMFLYMAIVDFTLNGMRYDVFVTLVGAALGVKTLSALTDLISSKKQQL